MPEDWLAWPHDENGDSILCGIFGLVWSRPPNEIRNLSVELVVTSVIAARRGYGRPPAWNTAGLVVATKIGLMVDALERQLRHEAKPGPTDD